MSDAAGRVKAAMRRDLAAAMKDRGTEVVSALRTAIALLDNAEAVDPQSVHGDLTEVARRALTASEVATVLRSHLDENLAEADRYAGLGHPDVAARLRFEAEVVRAYL